MGRTNKNLFVELSVRFRDLGQKMELLETIKTTHKRLSEIEFDIFRTFSESCWLSRVPRQP
jgi:hypothetical protein